MKITYLTLFLGLWFSSVLVRAEVVYIYNWSDYLSEDIIERFELETGHRIVQRFFDNEVLRDRVMLGGGLQEFDLVLYDSHSLNVFADSGYYRGINDIGIEGLDNHADNYRNACGANGVPYGWGTTGIAYRVSGVSQTPRSWMDLFTPFIVNGKSIVMPLDEVDTSAVLLKALGLPIDTENIEDIMAAQKLLERQSPYVIDYMYGLTFAELRGEASEMAMTLAYSSDIEALIEYTGQLDWRYVLPKEGGLVWTDCWALPSNRPTKSATIAFLNFLNQAQIAAENAEEVWFSTTNIAAEQYFSNDYLSDEILNPSAVALERAAVIGPLSSFALRLRNRLIFLINAR